MLRLHLPVDTVTRSAGSEAVLRLLNGVGLVAAVGFAAAGIVRPSVAGPADRDSLSAFWAVSSAVRTWSIAVPLAVGLIRGKPDLGLLVAAGFVQVGDAVLGSRQRNVPMAVLPALMAVVHFITARRFANG